VKPALCKLFQTDLRERERPATSADFEERDVYIVRNLRPPVMRVLQLMHRVLLLRRREGEVHQASMCIL